MKISKKQNKLLGHILGFNDLGQTPTHKELATLMGVTPPAITIMLTTLQRKGAVVLNRKWRGMVVTAQGLQALHGDDYAPESKKAIDRLAYNEKRRNDRAKAREENNA